ncbi:MAG: LLM class flavin-dependent oxidoreductase [Chloroflexi bacterium]|nr:LLM class flavin-dependent oxidoreductase [Chloroflexota bacterium]
MVRVELGWRVPMWPADDAPGTVLVRQIENHLRHLDGAFRTAWLSDHVVPGNGWRGPHPDTLEAWSAICHFAAVFPRYRFGHVVMNNSFRNPALLAKMAATTQLLTGGRLIMGIGAGWKEDEYTSYGYPYPPPAIRIGQLEDGVQIMRAMWTASPATFHGRHFSVTDAYCNPMPDPPIPIMIGGAGEQLTLRAVARHADWWNMPGGSPATYRRKLDVLSGHCATIRRDPATIALTWETGVVAVAPTRAEARRLAQASRFYQASGGDEACLIGEPGDVADQIRAFTELGVGHVILRFADFPAMDSAAYFAEHVVSRLET